MAELSKLSYIPAQYRVRLELSATDISMHESVPDSLLDRARKRLDKEVAAGSIIDYKLDVEDLNDIWTTLRSSILGPKEKVSITVAVGIPNFAGIVVGPAEGLFSCRVSIDYAKIKQKDPTFKMLSAFVSYQLAKLDLEDDFSVSELHQLWIKAKNGKIVTNIPLHKARSKSHDNSKGYIVRPAPSFQGIEVVLFDVKKIAADATIDSILKEVHKTYSKHPNRQGMVILKEHLVRRIRSAIRGPEKYGLMMPITILAASRPHGELPRFGLATLLPKRGLEGRVNRISGKMGMGELVSPNTSPVKDFKKSRPLTPSPGLPNYMEAASARDLSNIEDTSAVSSNNKNKLELVQNQAKEVSDPTADNADKSIAAQFGDKIQSDEERQKDLEDAKKGPTNVQVLKATDQEQWPFSGTISVSENGLSAFLSVSDEKIFESPEAKKSSFWKNYFSSHNLNYGLSDKIIKSLIGIINTGENLDNFEVAVGKAAQGCDSPYIHEIWKEKVVFIDGRVPSLKESWQRLFVQKNQIIGEIRFKNESSQGMDVFGNVIEPPPIEYPELTLCEEIAFKEGIISANVSGVPSVKNFVITFSTDLSFKGSVHNATGAISYDGDVIIESNIEAGAEIRVSGNLTVNGMIAGGLVVVHGTLEVKGGIKTGSSVAVKCSELNCQFVENSVVEVEESAIIERSVISSEIYVEENLTIGVGESNSKVLGSLLSAKQKLKVNNVGGSNTQNNIYIGTEIDTIKHYAHTYKRIDYFKELLSDASSGKVKKGSEQQNLKTRVKKLKRIISKLEEKYKRLKSKLKPAEGSRLDIIGQAYPETTINVGRKKHTLRSKISKISIDGDSRSPFEQISGGR